MDFHRGYTTIYDIGVYIIVFVFMSVLVREIFLMYDDERNKAYMIVCIICDRNLCCFILRLLSILVKNIKLVKINN